MHDGRRRVWSRPRRCGWPDRTGRSWQVGELSQQSSFTSRVLTLPGRPSAHAWPPGRAHITCCRAPRMPPASSCCLPTLSTFTAKRHLRIPKPFGLLLLLEKLPEALFSSKIFWKMDTVAFLFVFDKYCPIMD
jgi:hypothetical protein